MRVKLPENIELEMKRYRAGFSRVPESYINFHKELAEASVMDLIASGKIIGFHSMGMIDDGWLDGMMILSLHVKLPNKTWIQVQWHDGNCGWMQKCPSGGAAYCSELND